MLGRKLWISSNLCNTYSKCELLEHLMKLGHLAKKCMDTKAKPETIVHIPLTKFIFPNILFRLNFCSWINNCTSCSFFDLALSLI